MQRERAPNRSIQTGNWAPAVNRQPGFRRGELVELLRVSILYFNLLCLIDSFRASINSILFEKSQNLEKFEKYLEILIFAKVSCNVFQNYF